jgi:hypothetical protein
LYRLPASGNGYSINKGEKAFPAIKKISYSEDKKSVIIHVKPERDREYQFIMSGKKFMSQDGIPIKNYEVNFKTNSRQLSCNIICETN